MSHCVAFYCNWGLAPPTEYCGEFIIRCYSQSLDLQESQLLRYN